MHRLSIRGIAIFALGVAGCSTPVKWTSFLDREGVTYSYDAGSIVRYTSGRVTLKVLRDHVLAVVDRTGQDYTSSVQDWEFMCNAGTITRLSLVQFTGHNATGTNLSQADRNVYADPQTLVLHDREERRQSTRSEHMTPGSPEAVLFGIMCPAR